MQTGLRIALLLGLSLTWLGFSRAADTAKPNSKKAARGASGKKGSSKKSLLDQFDANGDGKLDAEEAARAKAAAGDRRTAGAVASGALGPNDGNATAGQGGPSTAGAGNPLAPFDINGNGRLDPLEAAAAKAWRHRRGGGGGRGPQVGSGGMGGNPLGAGGVGQGAPQGAAGPTAAEIRKQEKANKKKRLLEQFDTDGNGKLDPKEREAVKAAKRNNAKERDAKRAGKAPAKGRAAKDAEDTEDADKSGEKESNDPDSGPKESDEDAGGAGPVVDEDSASDEAFERSESSDSSFDSSTDASRQEASAGS